VAAVGVVVAAGAIFWAAVLPVLGMIPFDFQQYSTTSDHYMYVAMLGPALLVAWVLPGVESAGVFFRRRAVIVATVAISLLGARSLVQTFYWSDTDTLFAHALEVNPDSPAARVNLAIALADRGRLAEAAEHYRALLAVDPSNPKAHLGLGQVLARASEPEGALAHLRMAAELQPENPLTHYNLGLLLSSLGREDEAIAAYRRALEVEPAFPEAHTNLATALLVRGDLEGAERHYREALRIRPDLTIPRQGLEAVEAARRDEKSPRN
jgi:tetratricopeptide (TPR) repeat protein